MASTISKLFAKITIILITDKFVKFTYWFELSLVLKIKSTIFPNLLIKFSNELTKWVAFSIKFIELKVTLYFCYFKILLLFQLFIKSLLNSY